MIMRRQFNLSVDQCLDLLASFSILIFGRTLQYTDSRSSPWFQLLRAVNIGFFNQWTSQRDAVIQSLGLNRHVRFDIHPGAARIFQRFDSGKCFQVSGMPAGELLALSEFY